METVPWRSVLRKMLSPIWSGTLRRRASPRVLPVLLRHNDSIRNHPSAPDRGKARNGIVREAGGDRGRWYHGHLHRLSPHQTARIQRWQFDRHSCRGRPDCRWSQWQGSGLSGERLARRSHSCECDNLIGKTLTESSEQNGVRSFCDMQELGALSYDLYDTLAAELDGAKAFGYRKVKSYAVDVKAPSARNKSAGNLVSVTPPPTRTLPDEEHWLALPKGNKPSSSEENADARPLSWVDHNALKSIRMLSDEETTAQVDPLLFCQRLWQECVNAGVSLIKGRAEKTTQSQDGQVDCLLVRVDDALEHVPLTELVLAAGPWTGRLAAELLPHVTTKTPVSIEELPGHSIIYQSPVPLPAEALFATMRDSHATTGPELFTRPDGTVYIAGENTGAPLPPGVQAVTKDDFLLAKLRAAMSILAPSLTQDIDTSSLKAQLCYRPISTRGFPVLGRMPGVGNVIVCSGMGPWGITLGPGSGKIVAEMVLRREGLSANVDQLGL